MPAHKPAAYCPECDMKITFDKTPRLGLIVVCHACDTTLEVVQLSPLELDWAIEGSFDDDDDYAYDDEDLMMDEYEDY